MNLSVLHSTSSSNILRLQLNSLKKISHNIQFWFKITHTKVLSWTYEKKVLMVCHSSLFLVKMGLSQHRKTNLGKNNLKIETAVLKKIMFSAIEKKVQTRQYSISFLNIHYTILLFLSSMYFLTLSRSTFHY